MIMKLESLKSSKFEALTSEAMLFIVGGKNVRSEAGCYGGMDCSNDYTDGEGVHHVMSGPGNDIGRNLLDRICGEYFVAPVEGEEGYEEWILIVEAEVC